MPMPLPGASFAPTFENTREQRPQGGASSPGQALQVLSYRLKPRVAGAPGVSPLQGQQQSGSSIGQAVLESVLRTVLGAGAADVQSYGGGQMPGARGYDSGQSTLESLGQQTPSRPAPTVHVGDDPTQRIPLGPQSTLDPQPTPRQPDTGTFPSGGYHDWNEHEKRMRFGTAATGAPSFGGGGNTRNPSFSGY